MVRRIGGHVSTAGGLINSLKNTEMIGGNCMQIFAGSPRMWFRKPYADSETKVFLEESKQKGIAPVFIHALYLINLASLDTDLFEKSVNSLVMDLLNGSRIGSSGVIVHIGSHLGAGFDSAKDQLVASLSRILAETADCDLLLENDAGQNGKIGSVDELSYLIDKVADSRLKICLDTAHLFESGVDIRDPKNVNQFVSRLKELNILDKIACLHLNDSATDLDSHRDNHADLGKGKIGIEGLSNFINHPDFLHLPLILETPGENKQGPDITNIGIAKSL
jgi:deoxyribonuclease-4